MLKRLITMILTMLTLHSCSASKQAEVPELPVIPETTLTETTEATEATQTLPTEPALAFEPADEEVYLLCSTSLYEAPAEDARKLGSLNWGDPVHRAGVSREGWSALKSGERVLYVKTALLSQRPPYKIDNDLYITEDTALAEAPQQDAAALSTLKKGSKLTDIRSSLTGWYLVRFEGQEGFLPVERASLTPPVEDGDVVFTSVGRQTVYTIDSVNYRTGPGTEYRLLGEIPAHVQFIRTAEGSNGWDKVIYKGIECCVAGNYLTTTRPSEVKETEPPAPKPQDPARKPEQVAPDGHTHVYEDQIIPPTCMAEGYTNHACACGAQYADSFVPPLGHDWGPWQESIPATRNAPGEEIHLCTRCQASQSREIPQLPADACEHQWAPSGASSREISVEGMIATRERQLTCSLCGETKKETYQEVSAQAVSQAASQLFSETNALRAQNGLPAFAPANAQWNQWANLRAQEQAQSFSHTRPDGSSCFVKFGDQAVVAENVGLTSAIYDPNLGRAFYETYRDSPGHKANMLASCPMLAVGIYVDLQSGMAYSAMVMIDTGY